MKSGVRLGPGDSWKLPDQHFEASTCSVLLDARQGPRTKAGAGQEVCIQHGVVDLCSEHYERSGKHLCAKARASRILDSTQAVWHPKPETLNPKL